MQTCRRGDGRRAPMSDDTVCHACGREDSDGDNLILLCDGCDGAVHQKCYGVAHVPDGDWFCARCAADARAHAETPAACVACVDTGGIFAELVRPPGGAAAPREWIHVACGTHINEYHCRNQFAFALGGFTCSDPEMLRERTELLCALCGTAGGYPIQCAHESCAVAFHVPCAMRRGLLTDDFEFFFCP